MQVHVLYQIKFHLIFKVYCMKCVYVLLTSISKQSFLFESVTDAMKHNAYFKEGISVFAHIHLTKYKVVLNSNDSFVFTGYYYVRKRIRAV